MYQTAIQIKDDAGIPYGTITREWIDSASSETGHLGRHGPGKIDFPTNIDDKTKALLLATAMLVVSIIVAGYKSSFLVGSYIHLKLCLFLKFRITCILKRPSCPCNVSILVCLLELHHKYY